jgi:C4-dicarboxylate transporter/malic acid transport protein
MSVEAAVREVAPLLLSRPAPRLRRRTPDAALFGPNWYAAVMGTGIIATAGAGLPLHVPGLRALALAFWITAAVLLVAVSGATARHWVRHREVARGYLSDPFMAHFYGAPPMALMTVGAGALVVGRDLIGLPAAVDLDWALWSLGTAAGLVTCVVVPLRLFVGRQASAADAGGAWLMSVVPPMVSASTGALLVPHLPAGQARATLLLGCYAMFGLSLAASALMISLIWRRLISHDVGPARLVPTLWIVLGPLGQSVTAAGLLAGAAQPVLAGPYRVGADALALFYGLTAAGFAALWLTLAVVLTVRQARVGLPFALTWWSFTFPVGTCVTGATGLASRTGADLFRVSAIGLFGFLLVAWAVVGVRTLIGLVDGGLLRPAAPSPGAG